MKKNVPHDFEFLIGNDIRTGEAIFLPQKDYSLGGYFLGMRRVGKSTLLQNLIAQSIKFNYGVCLIDPHGDLLQQVINRIPQDRMKDVILFDPKDYSHPLGLNIYHCENKDDPLAVEYTANLVLDLYKKLWKVEYSQPMVEDIVLMTTLTIVANNMTMVEVPRLLFDEVFRQRLLKNVTNPDVLDFWKIYENPRSPEREQGGGTVGRRLRQFTSSGIMRYIIGQSEKTLNLRQIIDQRKILLIRLYSDLPKLTSLIGSTIVSQLLQAALSRSDTDKRPEFHLYCDEYSRFAVDSFAQIIEEAGKYNIIPFIAHQSREQIDQENQDSSIQLGNLFCFKLIGRDADKLSYEFPVKPKKADRPPGTVPAHVLPRFEHHSHSRVKSFWQRYIHPLELATKQQERERRGTNFLDEEVVQKILPKFNFGLGGGDIEYHPEDAQDALISLNSFFYEVLTNRMSDDAIMQSMRRVLVKMSYPFGFTLYLFPEKQKSVDSRLLPWIKDLIEVIPKQQIEVDKYEQALALEDRPFLAWFFGVPIEKLDEAWQKHTDEEMEKIREYEKYNTPEKELARRKIPILEEVRELERRYQINPTPFERFWFVHVTIRGDEGSRKALEEREKLYRELKEALTNRGKLLEILACDRGFKDWSVEKEWEDIVNTAKRYQKRIEEEYPSIEKYLVRMRDWTRKQLLEHKKKLEEMEKALAKHRNSLAEGDRQQMERQQSFHNTVRDDMLRVAQILRMPQYRIEVDPATGKEAPRTQQTYADRRNQIANKLVALRRGEARVKLPTGQYTIKTIPSSTSRTDERGKRTQVVEQTRRQYAKTRAEVEEEIRRRQATPNESPTKRRG